MLNLIATRIRTAGTTIQNKRTSAVSLCLSIFLFIAAAASIQAQTPVTLSSSALPAVAQPGVQAVRLTVTKVPSGTILASSITVSLAPATPGTGPSAQVTASGFARVVGTTANVTFTVPAALTLRAPTVYTASITGSVQGGATFASTNTSSLTIDPPASVSLLPSTAQQGQTITVTLQGAYTNFAQGATQANFGPGISVGGAAANAPGPVTVTSATSATAQIIIAANAAPGGNPVSVTTGLENPTTSFTVTQATAQPIDLAITKSHTGNFTQGQNGTYTIAVSNNGPGATSGTVTVTDTLPTGLSLVSMGGSGWSCTSLTCTRSDSLATSSAYPSISLVVAVAAGAAASVTNSVAVSGGGSDSNPANNSATDVTTIVQVPASVTATAGTPQSAPINTAFGSALQVTVKDAGSNPVSGVTVTFAAPASGASGSFAGGVTTAVTNSSGVATSRVFTANGTGGSYAVTATVSGVTTPASFALTNTAGTPSSITATSGTPQSAVINTAFGSALQVTVKDTGNNPVSGVTVTFAVPGSGASATFASGNTAVTNASGVATSSALTANSTAGSYAVSASVSGVTTPASFALTNTAAAATSVTTTAGTPQSAVINTAFGSALQVTVKDAGNNPVSGVTVTFTAPGSGASAVFSSGNTAVTNASGVATSSSLTANSTVGSYSVNASVSGVTSPATFALTNTNGTAASITATAGTPQSAPINTAFGSALQVTVKDAGNNPVSGVIVTFAAPASGASGSFASGTTAVTNASGVATASTFTANGTSGSYIVTASVSGVSGSASFALTNTAGTPASITATAGTPQSAIINTAFGSALQVTVKDSGNNPISGVTVTFAVPASGASATFASGNTAVTNASGVATSSTLTANSTAGSYSVTASVSGVTTPASFALTNTAGAAASVTATAGTPQSAPINTAFASTLQVTVKDAGNNPVSGVTVTFVAPASGASGSFASGVTTAVTNSSGVATSRVFTANGTSGSYAVTASVSGVTTPASFALTNTVGTPASITATAGTPQSAVINTAFGSALQVTVKDAGNNPVSGITVTFAVPGSGASATFVSGNTAVTNASGVATSSAITANSTTGSYSVTASVSGVTTPASFTLTNTSGSAASIMATAGTPQSAVINTAFGTALQVTVKDAGNNPVSGVTVTFAVPASGASATFTSGSTAVTNASGVATSSTLTANSTAGSYSVTASVSGVTTPASFALTNTAGAAASVTATAGTPQSAPINTAFSSALQVTVKDSGNNPVNGVTVTFLAPASGASGNFAGGVTTAVTNSSGVATSRIFTANGTSGSYAVTASVAGVTTPASFALTNTVGTPASITATAGTPQSAVINTAFGSALQVTVKDSGNNPVSGVTVTFTVPSSGASATFASGNTAVTNASGVATSSALTANSTTGSYSVTASVSGVSTPASFALTNTAGTPASITATAGTPQSAVISTAFGSALQVTVKDAGNNPISGVTVTFTVPSSGASATFASGSTAVTNASGVATSSTLTANSTAGSYSVTASVSGVTTPASFALTNTAGVAASVAATAGTPQSAPINTAFASTLQVTVKDSGHNPVSGVTVTFVAPASGASGSFAGGVTTAVTNSSGVATSRVFTANGTAGGYAVTASVSGVTTPASFALTNTVGTPASITATAGTPQSAVINTAFGSALQVTVKDSGNNPVSGVTVTFAVPSSGASVTFASGNTAVTNASGVATSSAITANSTTGTYSVTASVSGVSTPATFALTNTSGAAASITVNAGTPQSTIINTAFSTNLQVVVRDSGNNPVVGATVTFAVPSTGASAAFASGNTAVTNSSGVATASTLTANGTAGSYSVTASVSGVSTPASFSLTNTPGVPVSVTAYAGATESAAVSTVFSPNLQVIVKDSGNNPVSGITVTFAAPTSGATGTFAGGVTTATTNSSGIATAAVFTANTTPGSYQVTASVSGVSAPAVFTLTNTQAAIASLNPTSGALAQTLAVTVTGTTTHFVQGTTTAYFGTGITVNSLTVSSATAATVSITINPTTTLGGRTVTMTTGSEVATDINGFSVSQGSAAILSLNPATGAQAASVSVAVVGSNTNFQQGVTTASFGPNIGINSVTVTDLTHATVNITISGSATVGTQSVSLTTGGEIASLANSFTITSGTAQITNVNPGSGNQGDTADLISITGQSTHWVQGTTTASFGSGVTVTSLTVNSATSATAVIAIAAGAAIGNRTVTLTTGSEVANSSATAFSVAAGAPSATANPNFGVEGTNPTIVISGSFTSFVQGVTTVTFNDSQITVGTVSVNGPTQLSVPIQISTQASVGSRTITMNTNGNIVTATFSVAAGMPVVTLINPNVGVPNSNVSVHITGNFTNWVSGSTKVSFGAGIAVGGGTAGQAGPVTINNSGDLTASIAIASGAALGSRTVTITTGTSVQTVNAGFTVETCTTTAAAPILFSPAQNATNVPLNTVIQIEFNAPINRTTVNTSDFILYDTTINQNIPATVSVDASGRIMTLTPSVLLGVGHHFYTEWGTYTGNSQLLDTCGNVIPGSYYYFDTTFSTENIGPSLLVSSPLASDTVAENYNVVLQFSAPINPITQPAGFVVSAGGTPVAGTYTPSPDYTQYTFVPTGSVQPNTVITVTYSSALQDGAGNALTNPGSYTFTTNSATLTTNGDVTYTDPFYNQQNVVTTVHPTVYFSRPVDPITVNTGVLYLNSYETGRRIPATVSVSADRMSAEITPLQTLQPNTEYYFSLSYPVYDLDGVYFSESTTYFYTGSSATGTSTTVATISPTSGTTGAPVNTQVAALMSAPLDPGSITNGSITVKAGSTTVAGTVSLGTDQMTLTFTPTANLQPSTTYSVSVGGFLDGNENTVQTFTSSFTTGSSGTAQTGTLSVISVSPVNGASNVANNSPVTITFSSPVDPASINNILVRDANAQYAEVSGTFALASGNPAQVVFTPSTPYPASAQIQVYTQDEVKDLAGNTDNGSVVTTFTVAATTDTSTFQVVSVSPANNMTGVGRNATIVLTFNKSVNPASFNNVNALQLFAGDQNVGVGGITYSADGRSISFTPTTPAGVTVNINATPLITDISGNPLVNFASKYSTSSDITGTGPQVVQMLPASGSSDVLQGMPITLYTNGAPLNPSTVTNTSLYVSQNGILVQGTIQVSAGGQSISFLPSASFSYSSLVQVFVQPTVTDIYGNVIGAFSGQFTIQGNPASVAPVLVSTNPVANSTNAPLNVLPKMKFDQQLLASSVNSSSVGVYENCNGTQIPGTAAVVGDGTILQFTPSSNLPATCNGGAALYYMQINNGTQKVSNLDGIPVSSNTYFYFTVTGAADHTPPTVVSVAPPAGSTNVGVNAVIYVQLSEPIDPTTVNGTTIKISGGSQTAVPATISFDSTGTYAIVQPELPLPANAVMTLAVNGVTDFAGNSVTPYSSTFTTAADAVTATPQVIYESVAPNAMGVPTNATFTIQFDQPMAPNSFTSSTYYLLDTVTSQQIPATITVSSDGTSATLTPTALLNVNRQYYYLVNGARGVSGNASGESYWYFTTEALSSSVLPIVTTVNPTNNLTNVPTNVIVQLLFNEPIAPDTVTHVTINQGGTPIAATNTLSSNNTIVTITPNSTLLPNTVYTVTATGVVDFAGHTQTTAFSSTFTTAASSDISTGSVAPSYIPEGNQTNVALNIHPTFYLTKQVNPISVVGQFTLRNYQTGGYVAGTTTVSSDQLSITFTPAQNLQPQTEYYLSLGTVYDITGNYISGTSISFTTGAAATTTGASVSSISPLNNQTGIPLNTQVVAVMSAPVSQNTFGTSPITVMAGSTPIAGTTTLATDEETLTFTPTSSLASSTAYTVSVGGFKDQNGNTVQTASSSFTTGTTTEAAGSFVVNTVSPANGATVSSNTSNIVITFNQPVDPSTINNVLIRDQNVSYNTVDGTWSVNGAIATFTPLTPYPANHVIQIYVQGTVLDLAGVGCSGSVTSFTAANVADSTAPTVTSVTPSNSATGVGVFPSIVLTFSKSINQQTVNTTSIAVFAGDSQFTYSVTFPSNGRSIAITLNAPLPANTIITLSASSGVQDLSGNALVPFQSQFTTGSVLPTQSQGPQVIGQIPASSATDIAQGTVVTIYTNGTAISSSSVNSSSIQLSQNGQLVNGSATLIGDGHAIEFTPSAPLPYGALIQVFLNTSVTDIDGYPLQSAYTGQFTIQGNPTNTAPQETGTSPLQNSTVAPNVVPQMRFDQQLLASTLNASTVQVTSSCAGTPIAGTPSLVGNGTIVQFKPSADLTTQNCTLFYLQVFGGTNGVTNTDGVLISGSPYFAFNINTTDDTSHPTVTALGPPAGTQNVGINAEIYVQFNKPINPLSVTGSTIAITGNSQTVVPATISFNSTNAIAIIQPSTPLPPSTTMTIAVSGVTDPEGNTVTASTTTFKTEAGPDTAAPTVIATSFTPSGTIPLNTTAFSVTFSKPMDPLSVNTGSMILYDQTQAVTIPGLSVTSSDMMTFVLTIPAQGANSTQFNAGDQTYLQVLNATDITGNSVGNAFWYVTVGSTNDTVAPTVTKVSPEASLTNVPTNALPQLEFSQEMSTVSVLQKVQLLQGTTPVPATLMLSLGDTVATITPNDPLAEGTLYTISAVGVQDVQGTAMASPYTANFTTSTTGINLNPPTVVSVTPANGATGVSASVAPSVVFSAAMDPLNFDPSLVYGVIENNSNSVVIPAAVTFSSDGKTVTFTPTSALTSGTTYRVYITYYYITDVAGNRLSNTTSSTFTIQ